MGEISGRGFETAADGAPAAASSVGRRAFRLPSRDAPRHVPRRVPEGTVPLVAFEGSAYDCGRAYGEWARAHHPGYERYLRQADGWGRLDDVPRRLFERHAAYVPELFLGLRDSGGRGNAVQQADARIGK